MPQIERLDEGLRQLGNRLEAQAQAPLVPLQALRKQLHNALQGSMHDIIPATQAYSPAVVVLKLDAVEAGPRAARKTRWPWVVVLLILLGAMFWWWAKERWIAEDAPIHLDNLVLFPPGRAELKPEATKMLVNSLVDIKAQPGWLIVITGHSDTSGNPERNLELSRKRAEAVKAWMQRMGDIPESCFVVQGKGAGQPIADNDTERGRRANRRVDIRLMPSEGACKPTSN
ncbi:OmpA family protein [Pseudomonas sp. S 311-6]|nr:MULTISPECIES: OmpA family protein [Pseudomonas]MCO7563965.1 OmpA family protein [Pseudomonas mosselii]MCO7615536.1 OmpA family protein [Pseudomonas guariconensis]MCO7637531.1 OmpA family protein [Pseudomonas sp. S 311-6]